MKIIIKESQYVYLLENLEKKKKFLNKFLGIDFTGNIQQITSVYDVPMEFDRYMESQTINYYLNKFGPMYLFELDGKKYIYQDIGNYETFIKEDGGIHTDKEILERLGIDVMGLRFSDIIDIYFNKEDIIWKLSSLKANTKNF